ncbi:MAG TPA: hypothetical protein VMT89_09615 [Candidatus Acidoferrales bacterium]|nr:hypothetical protein [Candidatus Acidoferrales bacterium]
MWRTGVTLWTLSIVAFVAPPTSLRAQSCPGDLNGDNEVTIDELITAVNASLNGCPAAVTPTASPTPRPTPTAAPVTGCTLRFDQSGGDFCMFIGHINTACGNQSIPVSFSSLPGLGVFLAMTPPGADCTQGQCYTFLATPTTGTTANLTHWSNSLFDPYFQHTLSGDVELSGDGETLTVTPTSTPFSISGCPFVEFDGTYRSVN